MRSSSRSLLRINRCLAWNPLPQLYFRGARTLPFNQYETYISIITTTWTLRRRRIDVPASFQASAHRLQLPRARERNSSPRQLSQAVPAGLCPRLSRPQQRIPRRGNKAQLRGRSSVLRDHRGRFDLADRGHASGDGAVHKVTAGGEAGSNPASLKEGRFFQTAPLSIGA